MYALIFIVFVDLVGFGIVLPLLPLYAQAFGASAETVTLVAASYTLAQAVFAPFWGWLSDRIGRKPVLMITIGGTACGYILLAFTDTLLMLFAARFFGGAMAANMSVAHALIADVTRADQRTRSIARLGGAAGLGFVAGPAIGGLLAGDDPTQIRFLMPYLAAAAFSAVAFVLAAVLIRESVTGEQKQRARQGGGLQAWIAVLRRGETRLLFCLMFMTPFVFAGIEVIIVLWSVAAAGVGHRAALCRGLPDDPRRLRQWSLAVQPAVPVCGDREPRPGPGGRPDLCRDGADPGPRSVGNRLLGPGDRLAVLRGGHGHGRHGPSEPRNSGLQGLRNRCPGGAP